MKKINIYIGIAIIIILLLISNLFLYKPNCGRMHFGIADRTKNVIANAEMAQRIVEIHLYREDAGILELYEELDYDVDVTYDELNYEWIVHFSPESPDRSLTIDSGRTIWIRRDNGLVTNVSR